MQSCKSNSMLLWIVYKQVFLECFYAFWKNVVPNSKMYKYKLFDIQYARLGSLSFFGLQNSNVCKNDK